MQAIVTNTFRVPPCTNKGQEDLIIETKIVDFGELRPDLKDQLYLQQEITLLSCGNSATFDLCNNALTPEILRDLANSIERDMELAKRHLLDKKLLMNGGTMRP